MNKIHSFNASISWNGSIGMGTADYNSYSRNHTISSENKPPIPGSSDPLFRGDKTKYNPEELLVASASSCHMLWYLHLCAISGVIVLEYADSATGQVIEEDNGSGHFKEIHLSPVVLVQSASMVEKAIELHSKANQMCFIANSCNFPIRHTPQIKIAGNKQ